MELVFSSQFTVRQFAEQPTIIVFPGGAWNKSSIHQSRHSTVTFIIHPSSLILPMIPPDLQVSDRWKLRSKTLFVGRMPLLMGIINVTPDSFSDGGKYFDPDKAVEHGLKLAGEGADILDIGGQSTRPGAERVSVEEELRRVMPVVSALCRLSSVPISIDTFEPGVAEEALVAGVEIINDITAFTDPEMLKLAVSSGCGVCAMHMQGTPQTMQEEPGNTKT